MLKGPTPTKVNIGFLVSKPSLEKKQAWMAERRMKRANMNFEKEIRSGQLPLNLEEARNVWLETTSPDDIRKIADHYNIFQDLFGNAFFFPVVQLVHQLQHRR